MFKYESTFYEVKGQILMDVWCSIKTDSMFQIEEISS